MIRKILSLVGAGALVAGCYGGTTTTETEPALMVPATRTVPVYEYEEVDVETPETPETPIEPATPESPDVEYEIEIDD